MRGSRVLVFCTVLALCVGCDHAAKRLAESALAGSPGISLAADLVRLELTANSGAFLSLGAGLPDALRHALFLGGIPVLLALVCAQLLRSGRTSRAQLVGVGLLAGGGLGNWLDRLMNGGAVTDFVSIGLGGLRTGVFNVADVAVLLGIALVLLARAEPEPAPAPPPA
jgi:signal peptidase II